MSYTGRQLDIAIELRRADPHLSAAEAIADAYDLERRGRGAVFRRAFPWWAWLVHAAALIPTHGAWGVGLLVHFTVARYRVHYWTHGVTGRMRSSRPPPGRRRSRR